MGTFHYLTGTTQTRFKSVKADINYVLTLNGRIDSRSNSHTAIVNRYDKRVQQLLDAGYTIDWIQARLRVELVHRSDSTWAIG